MKKLEKKLEIICYSVIIFAGIFIIIALLPNNQNWLKVIEDLSPIFTLLAIVVALFKERFIAYMFPLHLKIEKADNLGEKVKLVNDNLSYYYHLKVKNYSNLSDVENCSVLLIGYTEGNKKELYNALRPFPWAPADFYCTNTTITNELCFDFFAIVQYPNDIFKIHLLLVNNSTVNVKEITRKKEITFHLCINGKGLKKNRFYDVTVMWNGLWNDDVNDMGKNVEIMVSPTK